MISLKEGGYYNRAALIRMCKSLQRIRTLHEMKFNAMQCNALLLAFGNTLAHTHTQIVKWKVNDAGDRMDGIFTIQGSIFSFFSRDPFDGTKTT